MLGYRAVAVQSLIRCRWLVAAAVTAAVAVAAVAEDGAVDEADKMEAWTETVAAYVRVTDMVH